MNKRSESGFIGSGEVQWWNCSVICMKISNQFNVHMVHIIISKWSYKLTFKAIIIIIEIVGGFQRKEKAWP